MNVPKDLMWWKILKIFWFSGWTKQGPSQFPNGGALARCIARQTRWWMVIYKKPTLTFVQFYYYKHMLYICDHGPPIKRFNKDQSAITNSIKIDPSAQQWHCWLIYSSGATPGSASSALARQAPLGFSKSGARSRKTPFILTRWTWWLRWNNLSVASKLHAVLNEWLEPTTKQYV